MKMSKTKIVGCLIAATAGYMYSASAIACDTSSSDCNSSVTATSTDVSNTVDNTTVTTTFSGASQAAALRLQSVYQTVEAISQHNTGNITTNASEDDVVVTGAGNYNVSATISASAIGNNVSAGLIGLRSVDMPISQVNNGNIVANETLTHPFINGNMILTTTAVGNNASVNWDLTTDKNPTSDTFGTVTRDGALMPFSTIGSFNGSLQQCNTGDVTANLKYMQDPANNVQISATAIGNNISFGVLTR